MSRRTKTLGLRVAVAAVLVAALGACTERSQKLDQAHAGKKADAQPWMVSDAANPAFRAPGWKDGDKAAWEEQLRKRNQAQNDYAR